METIDKILLIDAGIFILGAFSIWLYNWIKSYYENKKYWKQLQQHIDAQNTLFYMKLVESLFANKEFQKAITELINKYRENNEV